MSYDPLDPATARDPYPAYERLRDEQPLAYLPEDDLWVVSRYADVVAALRQPELFSSELGMGALMRGEISPRLQPTAPTRGMPPLRVLIAADPPDHTKLRRLVNRPFTPRSIASLEPRVREIAAALVDDLLEAADDGRADLIDQLAYPLPVIVIAEMLGIPTERRDDFKRWSDDMVGGLGGGLDPERAMVSSLEMFQFFADQIARRMDDPGDDLISLLVSGPPEDRLTTPELVLFCILLLIAGNETTTNLIANQALAFFAHPDQVAQLSSSEAMADAVEEVLRYDAPVQGLFRETRTATALPSGELPPGARVLLLFGSANRDPRRFVDAERFDVSRRPLDHLAFGSGIHLCLGAPLARLEARVAWEVLRERTAELRTAGDPTPVPGFVLRGCSALPVACRPR